MRVLSLAAIAAAFLAAPSLGAAQEVQVYSYDVHGRLTAVARTQSGQTRTTSYGLDDANNRTSRATTVTSALASAPSEQTAEAAAQLAEAGGPAVASVQSTAAEQSR